MGLLNSTSLGKHSRSNSPRGLGPLGPTTLPWWSGVIPRRNAS